MEVVKGSGEGDDGEGAELRPFGLTEQQQRFCEAYLAGGEVGKDAAIAAGYSPKHAASQASRNLSNDRIVKYIALRRREILAAEGHVIAKQELLVMLSREIETCKSDTARKGFYELLMKHHGMMVDRFEDLTAPRESPAELVAQLAKLSPEAAKHFAPLLGVQLPNEGANGATQH